MPLFVLLELPAFLAVSTEMGHAQCQWLLSYF